MNEMRFYAESARYTTIKRFLFIVGTLAGAMLLFTGILVGLGEHNDFVRVCRKLSVPAAAVAAVCIGGGLYVYFRYRESIAITHLPQGVLQMNVRNAEGVEYGATGRWSYHALYTKHYHKYGTYRKQLYLILFCNDKMFCMMRHDVAPAFPPPEGFREIPSPAEVDVPVYFTRKTEEVFGILRRHIMQQTQQQPTL